MNQITKEELLPYVAHNVNAICVCTKEIRTVTLNHFTYDLKTVGINHLLNKNDVLIEPHKLLLRPLYQLTKPIEHNGKKFVPIEKLSITFDNFEFNHMFGINEKYLSVYDYKLLLSWHFDIFGLIDRNLAEPIV